MPDKNCKTRKLHLTAVLSGTSDTSTRQEWGSGVPDWKVKMKVNVKFLASVREVTGMHEMQFELHPGDTVETLLDTLESRFGADLKAAVGKPFEDENPRIRFLVNGRDIDFLKGSETELKEGDTVVLIPPVAGG